MWEFIWNKSVLQPIIGKKQILQKGVNSSGHHCSVSDPEFFYIGRAKENSLPGMGGGGKGGEISWKRIDRESSPSSTSFFDSLHFEVVWEQTLKKLSIWWQKTSCPSRNLLVIPNHNAISLLTLYTEVIVEFLCSLKAFCN